MECPRLNLPILAEENDLDQVILRIEKTLDAKSLLKTLKK